jgi:hypothetical protein
VLIAIQVLNVIQINVKEHQLKNVLHKIKIHHSILYL